MFIFLILLYVLTDTHYKQETKEPIAFGVIFGMGVVALGIFYVTSYSLTPPKGKWCTYIQSKLVCKR